MSAPVILAQAEINQSAAAPDPPAPTEIEHRILVIDDTPAIHEDFRKVLNRAEAPALDQARATLFGFAQAAHRRPRFILDSAYQGQEGLARVQQALNEGRPYALAFVDVRMPPGWDGMETILRLWSADPELQVVICTAHSDYSWDQIGQTFGNMDGLLILKKPFDTIEALQLAHALTRKWSLTRQAKSRMADLDRVVNERTEDLRALNDRLRKEMAERTHAEAQLRHAQKMEAIGHLAGGVAHDFNNLLAVIRGNAELALMNHRSLSDATAENLEQVIQATDRAANLTRQLLAFGRKQVMFSQPLLLNQVITNVTKMLNRIIGEHIQLSCNYAARLPFVQADAAMIEQVLVNLAVNARDAMPQGGQLLITAEPAHLDAADARRHAHACPGDFACLTVTDTGTGIAPENLPRIFEPFFTTKEVGKGSGLGLATVYGIIQQHQGWVEVATKLNAGSSFKIFLPAIPAPPEPLPVAALAESEPVGGTEVILLVEDDEHVRSLTSHLLKRFGYHVQEAASGSEALEVWRLHKGQFALLLTDMIMPGHMSGRELAERLLADQPALKVIFMSGYSGEAVEQDISFLRRSRARFLQKPCGYLSLLKIVRESLDETGVGSTNG